MAAQLPLLREYTDKKGAVWTLSFDSANAPTRIRGEARWFEGRATPGYPWVMGDPLQGDAPIVEDEITLESGDVFWATSEDLAKRFFARVDRFAELHSPLTPKPVPRPSQKPAAGQDPASTPSGVAVLSARDASDLRPLALLAGAALVAYWAAGRLRAGA